MRASSSPPVGRVLGVTALVVLLGVLPFLSGLVGALILYVIVEPLHARLARRMRPRMSAFILTIVALVVLLLPGLWLVSTIVMEMSGVLATGRADAALSWLARSRLGSVGGFGDVNSVGRAVLGWMSAHAAAAFGSVTLMTLNVAIALFGLYYLLFSGPTWWLRLKALLPMSPDLADTLAARFAHVTNGLLLGTLLTVAVQGTVVGLGCWIVGLQAPLLWGFATACVGVLPLFGSALVWVPGSAVLLLDKRPGAALFLFVLGAGVVSNLDNLIRPMVYRRVSGIHPMLTIVGAFAGVRLFGLVGALLGPLLLSYFFELVDVYEQTHAVVSRSADSAPGA